MSVLDNQVVRQCLSLLPLQDFVAPILDYRKQKLTTVNVLKIFIAAQMLKWPSLDFIEKQIRSDVHLQAEFGISSISKSQISRRINGLPDEIPQALFHAVVHQIREHPDMSIAGVAQPLALVDSTNIRLPFQLADWAYATKHRSGVKVHTRLMVIDKGKAYPDKIVSSTGNVSDYEGSDPLVVDRDVLYVMDRGYVCYKRMERWVTDHIDFVMRVNGHHYAEILKEHDTPPTDSFIRRDASVLMGNNPSTNMKSELRMIEFVDDKGRSYRLVTTRWDLPAKEITEIYRQRWLIELFFKWMKQHLRFAQLYSYQPNAVWNHIYLALVTYGLSYLIKLKTQSKKSCWDVLVLIRIYAQKLWSQLEEELYRIPSKTSKGRQKREGPPKQLMAGPTDVALVKPSRKQKR